MAPPARCHDFPARVVASVICGVRVGSSAKDQHRSARAPHIAGRHIIRCCCRWACHLSQRFGAHRSDHRGRDRRRHHARCRTDRFYDAPITPYARSDRIPLRATSCCRWVSCRTRPRAHWCTRRRLATGNSSCGRNHRGGNGLGAHGACCPAPYAGQGIAAGVISADVAAQAGLSFRRLRFQWRLEPISDHQRATIARLVAGLRSDRGVASIGRDTIRHRACAAGCRDMQ
jgi:hypothetical protein